VNAFHLWWSGLSPRDQRVLAIGGALAALLLAYATIWLPLQRSRDSLRAQTAAAEASLRWMQSAAAEMQSAAAEIAERRAQDGGQSTSVDRRSLLTRVDAGAREQGLGSALLSVEPASDGRVSAVFQQASFDALAQWLESLSRSHGTRIVELSAQSTGATGQVDARVMLAETP